VVLECDEDRHVSKDCEDRRMMEIFTDLGSRPLVMIRFNPDKYRDENDKKVKGCFSYDDAMKLEVCDEEWARRWDVLKKVLTESLTTVPTKEITPHYLFY
jgi:hypothetical protein